MRTVFIECDRFLSRDEHRVMLENMKYEAGDDVRIVLLAPGMRVAEPAPQWIPCSERLPEDGNWCLFTDGVSMSVERYKADSLDHFFPEGRWFSLEDAVAWMPLPEPYREGVNNDG